MPCRPPHRLRREPLRQAALERVSAEVDIISEAFNARVTVGSDNDKAAPVRSRARPCVHRRQRRPLDWPRLAGYARTLADFETAPSEFRQSLRNGKIDGRCSTPLVHLISTWAKPPGRLKRTA